MGMFSWECKGCNQELKMDEEVRLDGSKGIYDGYGRCGNFDYEGGEEPVAWHQKCYYEATDAEKLDETPSVHARNQGFGYPRADCMPEDTWGEYQEPPRLFYRDITTEQINEYLDLLAAEDERKQKGEHPYPYSFFALGHTSEAQEGQDRVQRSQITDEDVEKVRAARGDRFSHHTEHELLKGFEYSEADLAFFEKYPTTHVEISELAHDALNAVKRRMFKDCKDE